MPIRIGLIGCGLIGRFHASNIKHLRGRGNLDLQYVAVCDRHLERAEAFAEVGGCQRATTNADEIIDADDIDVVYVCTETSAHPALVEQIVSAGKHVFCEKPLAHDAVVAEQMVRLVEQAKVVHQVGLVLRFSPVFRVIEDMMGQENLGTLLTATLRDDQFFPVRGEYASSWRGDVEKAGGGALMEHSIHDIDLFLRLFGEVESVTCQTRNITGYQGIEDVALVSFQHTGGHQTNLASLWHDMDGRSSTRRLEVFFERGWFCTDQDYFGSVTYQLQKGEAVTLSADEVLSRYMALEGLDADQEDLKSIGAMGDRRFFESIISGQAAFPGFHAALAAHQVVDACYTSARESRGIEVERYEIC